MNLGDFINGVRNITGKVPDVLSFTLKLEHMDLDMAVNFNSEEEFQSMKSIFTKYIVQGWKKNENGGSIMEVLIDPIYPQAEVEIHDVEMGDEEWGF